MQQKIPCTTIELYMNLVWFNSILTIGMKYFILNNLLQLCNFYQQLITTKENSAQFQSTELKNKLKEKFNQKLKFVKPAHFSLISASEFVISLDDSILPNCLLSVLLGGGILKRLLIKNCANAVSEEIQDYPVKNVNGLQHHKKCQRRKTQMPVTITI